LPSQQRLRSDQATREERDPAEPDANVTANVAVESHRNRRSNNRPRDGLAPCNLLVAGVRQVGRDADTRDQLIRADFWYVSILVELGERDCLLAVAIHKVNLGIEREQRGNEIPLDVNVAS